MNKLPNFHVFTGTEPKSLYVSAVGGQDGTLINFSPESLVYYE